MSRKPNLSIQIEDFDNGSENESNTSFKNESNSISENELNTGSENFLEKGSKILKPLTIINNTDIQTNPSRLSSCPQNTFEEIAQDIKDIKKSGQGSLKINHQSLKNIINKKNKTLKKTFKNKNKQKENFILDLLQNPDIKPLACNLKNITIDYGNGDGYHASDDRVYTMYIYQLNNKIYKILYFNNEEHNYCRTHIEFEAFKEIFFTQKAYKLIKKNNINDIKVPKVLSYGIININKSYPLPSHEPKYSNAFTINKYLSMYNKKPRIAVYIEMEFLKLPILSNALGNILFTENDDWEDKNKFILNEKFQEIRTQPDDTEELKTAIITQFGKEKINTVQRILNKIQTAFNFFMRNNIYHNDESLLNIMYDNNTDTVGIIDFGMATNLSFSTSSASIEKLEYDVFKIIKLLIIIFNTLKTNISTYEGNEKIIEIRRNKEIRQMGEEDKPIVSEKDKPIVKNAWASGGKRVTRKKTRPTRM